MRRRDVGRDRCPRRERKPGLGGRPRIMYPTGRAGLFHEGLCLSLGADIPASASGQRHRARGADGLPL
jgi:hypothetical protein